MALLPQSRAAWIVAWLTLAAAPAHALIADHRLGHDVTPTSQTLRLDVDADKPTFSGSTRIALRVNAATDSFQLYAQGMTIASLALRTARGPVAATWSIEPEHGLLTVHTAHPLRPGPATLDLAFSTAFDTRADALYRLETGGHAYVFSQFECIAARRAFPCWDEPEFKIPWQLTLVVPRAHTAISNTPVLRDSVIGARRRVTFERTPPMPSYLLAIATGPLETVPILGMGVPGRVVMVKGHKRLAGFTARETPRILAALETYFGRRYPYRKLDLLAVPEFVAGAMENVGAVTFREPYLLFDPATMSGRDRQTYVTGTAHELSHMWFGDLVTMRWWDDLWLNESFASWLGDKISQEIAPEFNLPLEELSGTHRAMNIDARPSTHAMRQETDAFDNLDDLFDFITYQKGQAVLGMVERWVGPKVFQTGVRAYLRKHEWGSAESADLWSALSKSSGRDVSGVASSFLDEPGVPFVRVTLDGPVVHLAQSRFHGIGAEELAGHWKIPIALKWSDGTHVTTQNVLLTDSVRTVTLAATPTWLHPNADEGGYYRWSLPPATLMTLADSAAKVLSSRERLGLVNDLSALLDGGQLHGDEFLRLLARFGNDAEPQVVAAALGGFGHARAVFGTPAVAGAMAAYVRRTFGPALERIGPAHVAGETETTTQLRALLMGTLGDGGRDPNVLQRARALADAYLQDPASIDPSLAETALQLAASRGDSTLFAAYRRRFESATLPSDRDRLLDGLASFRDPVVLAAALDYSLTGPLRPQEIFDFFRSVVVPQENKAQVFDWTLKNFATLSARVAPYQVTGFTRAAGGCSADRLDAGRAFFLDPARHRAGMEKEFAKVADETNDCIRLGTREGAAVATFLTATARAD
jgi:cytosol alanyl aminopeptidase